MSALLRSRRQRLVCVSVSALALAGCFGGADDPAEGASGIDVRRVIHNNTETTVTYHLRADADFDGDADQTITWHLDWDGNFNTPGGAFIQFTTDDTATVVACSGGGSGGSASISREPSGEAGSTADNTVAVRFEVSALRNCGQTGGAYRYVVSTNVPGGGVVEDVVPDSFLGGTGITHLLPVL